MDTSKRFNGVILKMCFLGRPHLKKEGKKISIKDINKKLQDFHAMNIIILLTLLQYKKKLL